VAGGATRFIAFKIELYTLASEARLANTDFNPISTRYNFQLKASRRVKEQASAKYETLTDDCTPTFLISSKQT
jgi:hypothetical protein